MKDDTNHAGFLKSSAHYLGGQVLILLAGFISFPILTRLFSIEEYGMLSLLSTILLLGTGLGKFGLSNSANRFHGDSSVSVETYHATHALGGMMTGSLVALVFLTFPAIALYELEGGISPGLIQVVALSIALKSILSIYFAFYQASRRSSTYNQLLVFQKYGSLVLSLALMFTLLPGLIGFFTGLAVVDLFLLLFMIRSQYGDNRFGLEHFSIYQFMKYVKYGFPLVASELAFILFVRLDLYLINIYLGAASVGLYSVAFYLGTYLQRLIITPLSLAVVPTYLKIWRDEGVQGTSQFLSKVANYLLIIILPMAAGVSLLSEDIITVMASSKYFAAAAVMPWLMVGIIFYGLYFLAVAGLHVRRKTNIITILVSSALAINVGLNLILIPRYGITGAAMATALSYGYLFLITLWTTRATLPIRFNWPMLSQSLFAVAAMGVLLSNIQANSPWVDIAIKIPFGAIVYTGIILILNADIRGQLLDKLKPAVRRALRVSPW